MKYYGLIRPHPPSLLIPCILLCITFAPLGADFPPQNSHYPLFGEAVTECKYRTAHSKHSWLMDLTLPYLLRDSVENKYRELFHNNTFIPYIMRTPFTFPVPEEEETKTTTDGKPVGREHVEFVLGKKIQQALNKVQKKAKDSVITKRYTLAEPYVSTKDDGQPISMSDWYPDRFKDENFGTKEQKGAMYKPKIQPKIWKGIVNARGLWENKTLVNGVSDSFDPDYSIQDSNEPKPFPNGDFADGGAYDSEIPALKNRSMCPNILFITLGPGEHPVNNPVYMDSDYNFHDVKNFNGTWKFPNDSRPASPESKLEPQDALERAKYMNEVFNKTREHEKIMDEYPKDKWRNKNYVLERKKRDVSNATKDEDNKEDVKEQNDIKLNGENKKKDERNLNELDTNAKQARKQDEQKIRQLIDEEIMAKALHEKRLKNAGKLKEDQLKDNSLETQDKRGNIADRNNPNNAEKDRHIDVNNARTNAKTNMENNRDYENMDNKKITTHLNTEFNYDDIESYKELTPNFKNVARDNYEDMLKTEEIRRYMNHDKDKHEEKNDEDFIAKANYENLLKSEEIRRYGNLGKEKHEENKHGVIENEDSAISIHANIDSSTEEEEAKPERPKVDFLSFVEPVDVDELQEHLNVIEHNETLSSNQPKLNDKEELKPLKENKNEGINENEVTNKFTIRQTTERVQKEHDETTVNKKEDVTSNKEQNNIEKEHKTTGNQNQGVTDNNEPITIEKEHETTVNEKEDVENNKEEHKKEKEHAHNAEEQNIMTKQEENKEIKQNDMTNKPTTPCVFYESPELDSYREPAKDYEKTEEHEGQTYETYHHESQYTEPPPQKDRLDPEDVKKVYKGPKKPRIDDNKVVEMIRMTQLRKEYKESNKRDRTTPIKEHLYAKKDKLEDENEGKTDVENSKAKVNKFKYMITEMRKKFNYVREQKAKKDEDEATRQETERKERIQLVKEYYKTKYHTLNRETRKKVKDYPAIENTEEMAGFPVDWYRKNKDKVRTRKEIELEDIEEDLDREERDKMRYSRKKRDMPNENSMPKSRKKRSTKIMIKKDNKTYVISYKHLNLFRRKNVKIYLNHEHVRRFDNRRKKRHVVDKIDEGFDSENEFNGKYIQERNGNNLNSLEDHERDIKVNDSENEPIYLDSQDLDIRDANDNTEPHGIELRAEDIVDTNYIDPRETEGTHSDTKDFTEQINKHEDPNNKNPSIDIKQIDNWVNLETNEIETWLSTNQTNSKDNIETFNNTPDIDSVDMHQSELIAENDDGIGARVKRDADFVYVTRPKRGWKKHIKDKIREIKSKLSTKFKDRIYEWTTKHKWETLPDEKDRTTPTLMKKRFLNIKKIQQMI